MFKSLLIALALTGLTMGCTGDKKVSSDEVISSVVTAMCKKMAECQPNAMPSEDFCQNTMKTALSGNKNLPNIEATKKQLDECVNSINTSECEGLLGKAPPKGCEFLQ